MQIRSMQLNNSSYRADKKDAMIPCRRCSASNMPSRRFCRECGTILISTCQQCGFVNMSDDKFCGGCGINLFDLSTPDRQAPQKLASAAVPGKYSDDNISELFQGKSQKKETVCGKKDLKASDSVSQDMLDNIFDSTDSD